MRASEIRTFVRPVHSVKRVAEKLSIALLVRDNAPLSQIVVFEALVSPTDLSVELLNIHLTARLEYVKFAPNNNEAPVISGQFAFFRKTGDKDEVRLNTVVRLHGEGHIILPGGGVIDVDGSSGIDEAEEFTIREAVSVALLSELIEAMPAWSFN